MPFLTCSRKISYHWVCWKYQWILGLIESIKNSSKDIRHPSIRDLILITSQQLTSRTQTQALAETKRDNCSMRTQRKACVTAEPWRILAQFKFCTLESKSAALRTHRSLLFAMGQFFKMLSSTFFREHCGDHVLWFPRCLWHNLVRKYRWMPLHLIHYLTERVLCLKRTGCAS